MIFRFPKVKVVDYEGNQWWGMIRKGFVHVKIPLCFFLFGVLLNYMLNVRSCTNQFIIFQYCSYNLLILRATRALLVFFFFLVIRDIHVYSWIWYVWHFCLNLYIYVIIQVYIPSRSEGGWMSVVEWFHEKEPRSLVSMGAHATEKREKHASR